MAIDQAELKKARADSERVYRPLIRMARHAEKNGQDQRKLRSPLRGKLAEGITHAGQFFKKPVEDHGWNQAQPTDVDAVRQEMFCLRKYKWQKMSEVVLAQVSTEEAGRNNDSIYNPHERGEKKALQGADPAYLQFEIGWMPSAQIQENKQQPEQRAFKRQGIDHVKISQEKTDVVAA